MFRNDRNDHQPSMFSSGVITEDVRRFLIDFRENLGHHNSPAIRKSYMNFLSITEETFQVSTWPASNDVINELRLDLTSNINDEIFILLYNELYFRHAFDRCDITYETLHESFQNYINLFNILSQFLGSNQMHLFPDLPNKWLWSMIHSFVSQFQYYHHWKNIAENAAVLLQFAGTTQQPFIQEKWNIKAVLRYLHFLVSAANIPMKYNPPPLEKEQKSETNPKSNSVVDTLGYFSLVGLLRIHCMVGDYRAAISAISCVDLKRKSAITRNQTGFITTHYYLAFASMMLRRFAETHDLCCSVLTRYENDDQRRSNRSKIKSNEDSDKETYLKTFVSNDALLDRIWALLAIAQTQIPQKLDEQLLGQPLNEDFGTEMEQISSDDTMVENRQNAYMMLFKKGCPDFLNIFDCIAQPKLSNISGKMLRNYQFRCFMRLTKKRNDMLKIKSELKLYQCIPAKQLANNMQFDTVSDLHRSLIRLKCSMKQTQKSDGFDAKSGDFDFFVENDLVHVRELAASKLWKYSNRFVRNIRNLKELIESNRN